VLTVDYYERSLRPCYNDHGHKKQAMKKMSAGEFKTHCLSVMDKVQRTKEAVLITKRGKAVAKLVPADDDAPREYIGRLEGIMKVVGDIESPIEPPEAWEVLR
jgi:prevent-host-death family protein